MNGSSSKKSAMRLRRPPAANSTKFIPANSRAAALVDLPSPLWWIYRHPGEAKYTVILIYPAAHQDSSPVSGRGALFVLFLSSGLLPLRRYQVSGEKGEGGHEQPGVGHGDLSRQLQVIRQDYRDGHTYTPAPAPAARTFRVGAIPLAGAGPPLPRRKAQATRWTAPPPAPQS